MPLFGGSRDVSLIRHLNRELINKIINTEIILYKLSVKDTPVNIYGESSRRVYYNPMKFNCLIERESKESGPNDEYTNYTRNATFAFLRDDLKDKDVRVAAGDVIKWDEEFYEVNKTSNGDLWTGRNPDTLPATVDDGEDQFGYKVATIATAHKVTGDKLQLEDSYTGNTDEEYELYNIL